MMFSNKKLLWAFVGFVFLNLGLYVFIALFHHRVSFHSENYTVSAHHFFKDPRIDGGSFNFINAMGQYDAQWYLKIARDGYPARHSLAYAYFPLYPLLLFVLNTAFHNLELTAFIISNVLLLANFTSLYFVISRLFSKSLALKTTFLIFLFPFSIFYRSYFAEGLYLLLLIWFVHFLIKKRFLYAGFLLGLANITKGTGMLLNVLFFYILFENIQKKTDWKKLVIISMMASIPFLGWLLFVFSKTGNPFYFFTVQSSWGSVGSPVTAFINNTTSFLSYPVLAFHLFHSSRVDAVLVVLIAGLLIASYKTLPLKLWLVSACLWLTPLISKDLMSYSRYQIVSFPLFLFLAMKLKGVYYYAVAGLFLIGLFATSLYFVNWYWVG